MNCFRNHLRLFRYFFFILIVLCLINSQAKSQLVVDTFDLPAGYTNAQLRAKTILKVDLSDNIWIGFRDIGAGKFDGTTWTMFDTTNGLPSNRILSFAFSGG